MTKVRGMRSRTVALAILLLINLVGTSAISAYTYRARHRSYYTYVDQTLLAGTTFIGYVAREVLSAEPTSVHPPEADKAKATRLLTEFARQTNVANLYVVKEEAGEFVFTASNAGYGPPGAPYSSAPELLRRALRTGTTTIGDYQDATGSWRSRFAPVRAKDGSVYALCADIPTSAIEKDLFQRLLSTLGIGGLSFVLMSLVGGYYVSRMTRRVEGLVRATEEMGATGFAAAAPARARLQALSATSNDDVSEIAGAIMRLEEALQHYVGRLTSTTAAKERIEQELKIAHDIQVGLLWKRFPPYPDRPEFELFAMIEPAKEVGGDLYDFFWVDDHRLFFVIGDVSDKGVPAALFMAVTKTVLTTSMLPSFSLSEVVGRVNDYLAENNPSVMFVTLFAALLDVRTGEIEYCDGGHNPPYLVTGDGRATMLPKITGLALGFSPGFQFQSEKVMLSRGDAIFLYTDGVTEAMDPVHHQFGEARLEEALRRRNGGSLPELLKGVMEEVVQFAAGAAQSDDITMLALRYIGMPAAAVDAGGQPERLTQAAPRGR